MLFRSGEPSQSGGAVDDHPEQERAGDVDRERPPGERRRRLPARRGRLRHRRTATAPGGGPSGRRDGVSVVVHHLQYVRRRDGRAVAGACGGQRRGELRARRSRRRSRQRGGTVALVTVLSAMTSVPKA